MAMTPYDPLDDVSRDPFTGMMSLRQMMNRLFDDTLMSTRRLEPFRQLVPIDVQESEDNYVIEASLPGIKPEEVEVTANDNMLTIHATRKHEEEKTAEKGTRYVRRERYEGEMYRTVALPSSIDAGKVDATYEHGVLIVTVPKIAPVKPTQIPVKGTSESKTSPGTSTTH
jgi:HSP20 family protein